MTRKVAGTAAAAAIREAPINLLSGWPSPKLLPPQYIRVAAETVLASEKTFAPALSYGPDEGPLHLRGAIGKWLTAFFRPRHEIGSDRICITGGASQNLACILQVFTDPVYTRNIWMVSPTYFLACRIFDDAGFAGKTRAVPEDDEGVDIDFLAAAIDKSEKDAIDAGHNEPKLKLPRPWRKAFKHIIYAVPTFSNPTGRLMSVERRQQLVRLARHYDALIVTDDVYDMLQWPVDNTTSQRAGPSSLKTAVLPRIVDIDAILDGGPQGEFGHAVSNGSFSKIVAPGCRTGWAEGAPKLAWGLSQAGSSRSGGCPSQFASTLIDQFLSTGQLESHITQTLVPAYSRRYHILLDAINTYLIPLGCTLISRPADIPSSSSPNHHVEQDDNGKTSTGKVAGGYFLYFTLPSSLYPTTSALISGSNSSSTSPLPTPAERITALAKSEENLTVIPGAKFRVEGDETEITDQKYDRDIRLSFAWEEEHLLEEGVRRLSNVIKRELEKNNF